MVNGKIKKSILSNKKLDERKEKEVDTSSDVFSPC